MLIAVIHSPLGMAISVVGLVVLLGGCWIADSRNMKRERAYGLNALIYQENVRQAEQQHRQPEADR